MAKFVMDIPKDIMKDLAKLSANSEKIFGGMTKAGAKAVANTVKANAPLSELANHVKISVTYKTPSDGGINTKVYFSGYLPFQTGRTTFTRRAGGRPYTTTKGVPAAFIANAYEYGTSNRKTQSGANRGQFSKKPFFRRSFRKRMIEAAMREAGKKLSGGLIE